MDWKRLEEIEARADQVADKLRNVDAYIPAGLYLTEEDIPWLCEQLREAVTVIQTLRDHLVEDMSGEQYFGMVKADDFLARFEK